LSDELAGTNIIYQIIISCKKKRNLHLDGMPQVVPMCANLVKSASVADRTGWASSTHCLGELQ